MKLSRHTVYEKLVSFFDFISYLLLEKCCSVKKWPREKTICDAVTLKRELGQQSCVVTKLWAVWYGVRIRGRVKVFFPLMSRQSLRPIQPAILWVLGFLWEGGEAAGIEVNCLPPSLCCG